MLVGWGSRDGSFIIQAFKWVRFGTRKCCGFSELGTEIGFVWQISRKRRADEDEMQDRINDEIAEREQEQRRIETGKC
jgi:hypothetical protein